MRPPLNIGSLICFYKFNNAQLSYKRECQSDPKCAFSLSREKSKNILNHRIGSLVFSTAGDSLYSLLSIKTEQLPEAV